MSDAPASRGSHAGASRIAEARATLAAWVAAGGGEGRRFLQVRLLATGPGRFEIRHHRDARRTLPSLETVGTDPLLARSVARQTNAGAHRPLKTAPDLAQGWAIVELDEAGLWTALDHLYPACALHAFAESAGELRVTHWRETAARQSGMYSAVRLLPDDAVRNAVRACCGNAVCLRRVAWALDERTPLGLPPETATPGVGIPCPEPCSMLVSFARAALELERTPRADLGGLIPLGAGEVEQLAALVVAHASGRTPTVRDGDFGAPLNRRRVRYLAARLAVSCGEGTPCAGCPAPDPCRDCPLSPPDPEVRDGP